MEATSSDLIKQVKRYQHCIQQINPVENDPQRVLHCIRKLSRLPIKLEELERTGIGKTINALRKLDGNIAEEATLLVAKWKSVVKKQVEEEEASEQRSDHELKDHSDHDSSNETSPINDIDDAASDREENEYDENTLKTRKVSDDKSKREKSYHKSKVHLITIKQEGSHERKRKHSNEDKDYIMKKEKYKKVDENSKVDMVSKSSETVLKRESDSSVDKSTDFSEEKGSVNDRKKKDRDSDRKSHKKDHERRHHKSSKHREEKSHRESKHHREEKHRSHHEKKHDTDDKYNSHKHKRDKKLKSESKDENETRKTDRNEKSVRKLSNEIGNKSACREVSNFGNDESTEDIFGAALMGIPVSVSPKKKSSSSKSSNYQESSPTSSSPKSNNSIDFLSNNVKLEPLSKNLDISDVSYSSKFDCASESYKTPLKVGSSRQDETNSPSYYSPREKPTKPKMLSEEDMFSSMTLMKNRRTKVYHGFKVNSKFPTLFELCVRVLQDNFDALEYTGGVPYDVLKPILEKVTVEQLYTFENYNPYLIGDTDELWEHHSKKHFRKAERQEYETWRDLYLRCVEEREEKLQSLTENISQSMANSAPIRKTKLAYLDAVVKPPRNVARKQAKHGTGNIVVKKSPKDPQPSPSAVQSVKERLSKEALSPNAVQIPSKTVKKKAPLMQKTLQLFKGLKR